MKLQNFLNFFLTFAGFSQLLLLGFLFHISRRKLWKMLRVSLRKMKAILSSSTHFKHLWDSWRTRLLERIRRWKSYPKLHQLAAVSNHLKMKTARLFTMVNMAAIARIAFLWTTNRCRFTRSIRIDPNNKAPVSENTATEDHS